MKYVSFGLVCGVAVLALTLTTSVQLPSQAQAAEKTPLAGADSVLTALHAEMGRAKTLKVDDFEAPYFVSYVLRDTRALRVSGKYGAVYDSSTAQDRTLYAEVRVGDYAFDSSGEGGIEFNFDPDYDYGSLLNYVRAPIDDDPVAIRDAIWLLTDYKYKEALQAYLQKKGKKVYSIPKKTEYGDFSREKAVKYRGPSAHPKMDKPYWEGIVRRISARLRGHQHIFDSGVSVAVNHTTKYIITSEGSEVVFDDALYSISLTALTRADDGMLLEGARTFYAHDQESLPDEKTLGTELASMISDLQTTRSAEALEPYSGPAILMPKVTGVFFHEAIGHRLEGKRQRSESEGQTFKGKVGQSVIPSFLTVTDDPSRIHFDNVDLNGYYPFDDEAVASRPVLLIERGVLREYLLSRSPIEGFSKSNGHGRNSSYEFPMARMANLIVSSHNSVSPEKLEKLLLKEVRKQGKPFGIIIEDIQGGDTNTERGGVQAFRGIATKVWKIDAKTGKKTAVRGVEFIGTPLVSINKIVATSNRNEIFNGFCGAESGYVPVSTVAPAALLTEIELQRSGADRKKPPILPPPGP